MKLLLNEKIKHRLVGLGIVLSICAILLPAVMKKSSQGLENSLNVKVKLPAKPQQPVVEMADEDQMFETIQVRHQKALADDLRPSHTDIKISTHPNSLEAENLESVAVKPAVNAAETTMRIASIEKLASTVDESNKLLNSADKKITRTHLPIHKKIASQSKTKKQLVTRKELYIVQLASFSQLNNAQSLVKKLQQQGYQANYLKTKNGKNAIFKVVVGRSTDKSTALKLKSQLAHSMHINGFVVNSKVS